MASGPKEGEKSQTLKVYAVTGEPMDKEVDYAGLRKDKPTVYVFVSAKDFDRPMFRYLKKLDKDLGDDGLVVAVWLTDDVDKSKEYLPKISQYFKGAPRRSARPPDRKAGGSIPMPPDRCGRPQKQGGQIVRLPVTERNRRTRGGPDAEEGNQEMR